MSTIKQIKRIRELEEQVSLMSAFLAKLNVGREFDEFINNRTDYFGEISMSVKVNSELDFEKFKSVFDEDGLRAELKLNLLDGQKVEAEVLNINETDWNHPDEE